MVIQLQGQQIVLDADRAIYFPFFRALVISDIHIGKATHFRRHGISVSNSVVYKDLDTLSALISRYQPLQVIITGDMFHSTLNSECEVFNQWRRNFTAVEFALVKGNHDIISHASLCSLGLSVYQHCYNLGPFSFVHDVHDGKATPGYSVSGHIHPGYVIRGAARQTIKLPCFHVTPSYIVLPAFSTFTGLSAVKPNGNDNIYAIADNRVLKVY